MNKSFVLIGILSIIQSTHTAHLSLNPHTKCAFARKRLEMTYTHLTTVQQELILLEKSLNSAADHEFSHQRVQKIAALKNEIIELKKAVPVLEKSLHALCKTIH